MSKLYFPKKNNNKKHDSEFFQSMCTRIEIITTMIFLLKKQQQKNKTKKTKNKRQPTYAIPAFNQHKTILLKNNNFGLISIWLRIRSVI